MYTQRKTASRTKEAVFLSPKGMWDFYIDLKGSSSQYKNSPIDTIELTNTKQKIETIYIRAGTVPLRGDALLHRGSVPLRGNALLYQGSVPQCGNALLYRGSVPLVCSGFFVVFVFAQCFDFFFDLFFSRLYRWSEESSA